MSSLFSVLSCSLIYIIWCSANVTVHGLNLTTTETFVTLAHDLYPIIENMFLPDGYELPMNLHDWNVSEILYYINEFDPEYLYIVPTESLVAIFPDVFLKQLPRDVLTTHGLYHLLPPNDTLSHNVTTNYSIGAPSSRCQYPFVETKHDSYFEFDFEHLNASFHCGLLCEYGDILYGIRPEDQAITDWFLYTCGFIFMFLVLVVFINQCMDNNCNESEGPCCSRGFMYHAPICIACFYIVMSIILTLPYFVGKENIVCAQDLEDNLTVSMSNPGGSTTCTIVGILGYSSITLFGLYTFGFTFVLWRQFFAPLRSLWSRVSDYKVCCLCVCCVENVFRPIRDCINARERYNNTVLHLKRTTSVSSRSPSASPRFSNDPKRMTCFDVFCSATTWAHYILYGIAITMTGLGIYDDAIDGFSPLGYCTISGETKDGMLRYNVAPYSVLFGGCTFFLPYAMYLLFQVSKYSTNKAHKKMMRKLGARILIYFIGMEISYFLICQTLWVFYMEHDKIMSSAEERMFCLTYRASTGDVDKCYEGFSLSIATYIQMALSMPLAGISSLGLSCHWKNRKRWSILLGSVYDCIRCKKTYHEVSLVTRLQVKQERPGISSKTPSSDTRTKQSFGYPSDADFSSNASKEKEKRATLNVPVKDTLPSISQLENAQTVSSGTVTVTTTELGTVPTTEKVPMPSTSSFEVIQVQNSDDNAANDDDEENDSNDDDDDEVP